MKIKRFFEQEEKIQISNDTVKDMLVKIQNMAKSLDENKKSISSIENTLGNFTSKSQASLTQIDSSRQDLQSVDTKLSDIVGILDEVIRKLTDYNDSGEKFLY